MAEAEILALDEPETFEALLKKIKTASKLKDKLAKQYNKITCSPEDMYEYEYVKFGSEVRQWVILHGKCFNQGSKKLVEHGYEFTITKHMPFADKTYCRARCSHCNMILDGSAAKQLKKDHDKNREKRHKEWLNECSRREVEEQERLEKEKEMVLLGLI